jgi:AAA domain
VSARNSVSDEELGARLNAWAEGELERDAIQEESQLSPLEEYLNEPQAHARLNGNGLVDGNATQVGSEPAEVFALEWYATLEHIKPLKHLVKNLLLEGSLFVVYGESNSGKTFWVLDVCLCVAAGIPWCTRLTTRGLVLYVAGEGAGSVKLRVAAYRQERQDIPASIPFAVISQAVNFLSPESVDKLIRTLKGAQAEAGQQSALVILDTFARAIPGGNENDAQDVGAAVAAADRIRAEIGCAVGFIHHCGKDPAKGARGSSALRAAADTEIFIERQSNQRTATVTKQRDLQPADPMPFELSLVQINTADGVVTSCVVKQCDPLGQPLQTQTLVRGKAQRQFLAAMRARGENDPSKVWSLGDLRAVGREIGLSKGTARSVVDALTNSPYMKMTAFGFQFIDGRVEG